MLFLKNDIAQFEMFGKFQAMKLNSSRELVRTISQYGQDELLRQAKLVTNMQGACSYYIEELFHTMQLQMDNVTANQHQLEMYSHHASISYLLNQHVRHKLKSYYTQVNNFTHHYKAHFDRRIGPKFTRYNKYLRRIHDNDWFQFPQLLYNESLYVLHRPRQPPLRNLSGSEVDFARFMETEEVEEVQWWPTQFWQRYVNRQPAHPNLPLPHADQHSPKCDIRADDKSNNMTTQTPAIELDSSKYFAPHLPGRSIRGPVFRAENVEQEYRFLTEADAAKLMESHFSIESFIDNMDTHILKIIFMVLDILLVIYRLSRTYMTATTLCRGFEESVNYKACKSVNVHTNMKESELQNLRNHAKHMNPEERTGDHTYLHDDKDQIDSGLTDYSTTLDSQKSMLPTKANSNSMQGMVRNDIRAGKPYPTNQTEWRQENKFEMCRNLIIAVLQNSLIPKLLIAFVLLLLFHTCVVLTCLIFSVDTVSELDGFQAYLAGLDAQVNQTNWYLRQQATHFNNVTMKIYEQQMRSELLHLQGMLEYFNAEQVRLVKNYLAEACSVKASLLGSRPCDVEVTPMKLTIPMLPCNFVPIQPQFYTGFNKQLYRAQLAKDMVPYLMAARQIVLRTGYAVLTVIVIMIIIHLSGAVLFHFLKTRHKFPVQRVYILSSPPQCGPAVNPPKDESDSEDHESGFKSYPTRVQMSPGKTHPKTEALMADFKYSETKV